MAIVLGCAAALEDIFRRTISNWTNLTGLAAGLLYHGIREGISGIGLSAAGALIGLGIFLVFYWVGALGGGDVKLMAAFGSLLGPTTILMAALFAALIGALFAAATLAWNRSEGTIPYAPAISLGAWMALLGQG